MFKRITLFALILVLLMWATPAQADESGGHFPFTVAVCQARDGEFRATITSTGDEPVRVGWVLDWAFEDLQQGETWLTSEQPLDFSVELPDDMLPNGLTFFYITQTWEWAFRAELTSDRSPCGGGGGETCAPSTGDIVEFLADTSLYWAPDESADTGVLVTAGQTARLSYPVYSTPDFVGIVWACQSLFVPAGAVGVP